VFEGVTSDVFGAGQSLTLNFGAAGVEVDSADTDLGTPAHAVVLASSVGFSDSYQRVIEETLLNTPWSGGLTNPAVRSDIVLFRVSTRRLCFQRWFDWMDCDLVR
jgi:N,N-dimethylformamidase